MCNIYIYIYSSDCSGQSINMYIFCFCVGRKRDSEHKQSRSKQVAIKRRKCAASDKFKNSTYKNKGTPKVTKNTLLQQLQQHGQIIRSKQKNMTKAALQHRLLQIEQNCPTDCVILLPELNLPHKLY